MIQGRGAAVGQPEFPLQPQGQAPVPASEYRQWQVAANDTFRAGARVLSRMGCSLEGWLYFPQLPELAEFARAVPDLPIILNHIGGLLGVTQ